MFNKITVLSFSIFLLLLFVDFAYTSQRSDIDYLKKELSRLQLKYNELEAKQAELYSRYEENLVNVDTNKASIQELYKKTSQLSQKINDLDIVMKNKKNVAANKAPVQLPSELYEKAYNSFLLGKYEVAMVDFKSFLKQYKHHDLAPQALYYIAESLYSQEKYSDAYEEYKRVEQNYPDSELIPSARLKMALCLELLNRKKESVVILQSILSDFPRTAEALTAKEKIRIYTNSKK